MKHYTIKINNKNSNNGSFYNNASKNLDNLILSNLKKTNPYLNNTYRDDSISFSISLKKNDDSILDAMFNEAGFNTGDRIIIPNYDYSDLLKDNFDTEFTKAAKFLSSYTPKKTYYYNSTPIGFFEDEIQIGDILIPLYKLRSSKYYNLFSSDTKKLIINIFISINR